MLFRSDYRIIKYLKIVSSDRVMFTFDEMYECSIQGIYHEKSRKFIKKVHSIQRQDNLWDDCVIAS